MKNKYNPILSYLGLILFLLGIGFVISLFYFVYEMAAGVRRFDIIILLFVLLFGLASLILGYKILNANRQ